MEAMFAKFAEKMDVFMQDVRKIAEGTQKETPRVFQVGEGSGVSSHIADAIPIVTAQRVDSAPTRPTMPTFLVEEEEQTASRDGDLNQHAVLFADWRSMGQEFMDAFPFNQYIQF